MSTTLNNSSLGLPLAKLLPVTGTFALPLLLTSSLLSFNVVRTRVASNTFEGETSISQAGSNGSAKNVQPDGNEYDPLLIASRAHANMMENMPVTLLLAALAELNGADRKKLSVVLALFSALRVSQATGILRGMQGPRALGYLGSITTQLGISGWLMYLAKGYWGF